MKKGMKRISCLLCAALCAAGVLAQSEKSVMLTNAVKYIETPYVAHTLDLDGPEDLVINCDEVDCTTLVEYVLAESLCPKLPNGDVSETAFGELLIRIRYRNGEIKGYTSRLHYISEWINNGLHQGFIGDVTATHSSDTQTLGLSYMSQHAREYPKLANSPQNVAIMKKVEKVLSGEVFHYLPKEKLPAEGLPWIKDGDIIAITTNLPGLDVAHMGLAMYVDGKLTLLHASSKEKKVVVSTLALSRMLEDNPQWTGIRVLRMMPQP